MKRLLSAVLLTLLWTATAAYAEVSIETSVSRSVVPVGEQLVLDVIINNAQGRIQPPQISSLEGFTSYSQGHSQEISIINGQSSSRSIFSYVLIANETGKKKIGPFSVNIAGKDYKIASVEIEVTSGAPPLIGSRSPAPGPVSAPPMRALPGADVSDQDIFVKAWLDKDDVYVNEPVTLTYTLYTRLSATYKGFEKEPVTTGFWVEDYPPEKNIRRTEQMIRGSRYVVADVRRMSLFPTQAGVFTIDPGEVSATVEVRGQDPFDNFFSYNVFGARRQAFSGFAQVIPKTIPIPAVTLTAKALPETGKPQGFSGAVGQYQIDSTVDKNEVEAGNPVTYRVRITGAGNLNTLEPPAAPKVESFKIYDSSSSVKISKDRGFVEGQKVGETVMVPRKAGTYTIPPVTFSYFDPRERAYVQLKTSTHTLSVKPGAEPESEAASADTGTSTSTGVPPVTKEDVAVLAQDIRYIKSDPGRIRLETPEVYKRPWYWSLNAGLLLVWALAAFFAGRRLSVPGARGFSLARSHAFARQKLRSAARLMKAEKQDAFYAEISKSVNAYFAAKLQLSEQQVSPEMIEQRLGDELPPALLNEIRTLFNELGMGRFASVSKTMDDMRSVYRDADKVITQFEKLKIK